MKTGVNDAEQNLRRRSRPLSCAQVVLTACAASLLLARPIRAQTPASIGRAGELGIMAIGAVTSASPAIANRRLTEGYLTQPNLMGRSPPRAVVSALRTTGTLNFEGYTLRRGELNAGMYGEGYIDRRHPHTLVHEAMMTASTPAPSWWQMSLSAGKGFTPYGTDDPMMRTFVKYPVNHHHAQIIERVQVLGAVRVGTSRAAVLEHGRFNGDEPLGPFTGPRWSRFGDSHTTRLTLLPRGDVEWQASRAFVKSPGLVQGGAFDHVQYSTSLRYGGTSRHTFFIEAARTNETLNDRAVFRFNSMLAEGRTAWREWSLAARAEQTDRPEGSRLLDLFRTQTGHFDVQIVGVTRWQVGTVQLAAPAFGRGTARLVPFRGGRSPRPAAEHTCRFVPRDFYGAATQWSITVGARLHVGTMRARMGRYGVLDPALGRIMSPTHSH